MAKIIFPGPNQYLICKKCRQPIEEDNSFSEDGQLDDRFCDHCVAFVDVIIVDKEF